MARSSVFTPLCCRGHKSGTFFTCSSAGQELTIATAVGSIDWGPIKIPLFIGTLSKNKRFILVQKINQDFGFKKGLSGRCMLMHFYNTRSLGLSPKN